MFGSYAPPRLLQSSQTIYLMRHGETDYNARGIVQGGGVDAELNERGRRQAEAFHRAYSQVPFTQVIASGLKRTRQTLKPFTEAGLPLQQHPGLNEMNWGVLEGAQQTPELKQFYNEMLDRWHAGELDYSIEGGESPREVAARVTDALRAICLSHPDDTLLICGHGRSNRILLCQLLGYSLSKMHWFNHRNTSVSIIHRVGRTFTIERLNCTAHLDGYLQAVTSPN